MPHKRALLTGMLVLFTIGSTLAQKAPYVIYKANGKKTSYARMLRAVAKQDIVLFGEYHNNPISHWLQYEVTADMQDSRELILAAEMFETDNQQAYADYVKGTIDYAALDTLARLWPNYKTDYAPLVDFAREHALPFVATNIPRRYARMVYRGGFEVLDTLSDLEKSWMAPLPIPFDISLPTYQNILKMMGGSSHGGGERLVMAQAIKDATMAHFIHANYKPGSLMLHFNGAFHSDYYEGILWYLKQANDNLNYLTISTVSQADVNKLEKDNHGKADFIICVDENMTTTY